MNSSNKVPNTRFDEYVEWVKSLQPGDLVILNHRTGQRLVRIERLTPKQLVVRGHRFWRESGRLVGYDPFTYSVTLLKPTPEVLKEENVRRKRSFLHQPDRWVPRLEDEAVERIANLIQKEIAR